MRFFVTIYNFIWEGISTKGHKTWGFPLKSFSCSFMTFAQQRPDFTQTLAQTVPEVGEEGAFKIGSVFIKNASVY